MKNKLTIDELLIDESFLNYYFRKDEADILEWEDWAERHAERQDLVKEAFMLLDKLSLKWTREQIESKLNTLNGKINFDTEEEPKSLEVVYRRSNFVRWAVAASVLLFMGLGWLYFKQNDNKSLIYKELVANATAYELPVGENANYFCASPVDSKLRLKRLQAFWVVWVASVCSGTSRRLATNSAM